LIGKRGYDEREVDDFLDAVETTNEPHRRRYHPVPGARAEDRRPMNGPSPAWPGPSTSKTGRWRWPRSRRGRSSSTSPDRTRGYYEPEVDAFLDRVAATLDGQDA